MKNRLFAILIIVSGSLSSFAQTPDWEWVRSFGSSAPDDLYETATDAGGNVYITGYLGQSITFDSITFISGAILAKYSASGDMIFIKGFDSTNLFYPAKFVIMNDNLYFAGTYYVDTLVVNADTLTGEGLYISRYDTDGNLTWIKNAGSIKNDNGNGYEAIDITADNEGNLYVLGEMGKSPETVTIGTNVISGNAQNLNFFAKYTGTGTAVWAKIIDGTGWNAYTHATSIIADQNSNIYISGDFQCPTLVLDTVTLTNSGYSNIFISKYATSGDLIWAKTAGGTDADYSFDIAADNSSNTFLIGYFQSPSIAFGDIVLQNEDTSSVYYTYPMFITKYDPSGNSLWAKSVNNGQASGIATDANGNAFMTGAYGNPQITFDSIILTHTGDQVDPNSFIVKYSPSGVALWAKSPEEGSSGNGGGSHGNSGGDIVIDNQDNVYVAGYLLNSGTTAIFGQDTLINHDVIEWCGSTPDIYLVKIHDIPDIINESEQNNTIVVFPNPTSGHVRINSLPAFAQIQVINSMGQVIQKQDIRNQSGMNLTLPESGIYFIRVISGKEVISKKVVVCR
ncbi:MAG: T9SS type A sorting domain-containing protein [Bacteroidia bacterium]|nr:T9SS type A sorting domain-containing protein [Bacteroidia bacterium]